MKLYSVPGSCSLASSIALREAGIPFEIVKVDLRARKTAANEDLERVNPKGYVPALALDNGELLTENVAVLQYIADRNPSAGLAPPAGTMERYRLQEWLGFISTELHKSFSPLFAPMASEDTRQMFRNKIQGRLDWLERTLGSRTFLMGDQFTVADAYLFVVLRWCDYHGIDLGKWPTLKSYRDRIEARPKVVEALQAEGLK